MCEGQVNSHAVSIKPYLALYGGRLAATFSAQARAIRSQMSLTRAWWLR